MNLQNKTIIITGASDGLGKEITYRLAKENTNLALIGRDKGRLEAVALESEKLGAKKVMIYVCDICDSEMLEKIINNIITDFGNVNILINDAGIWQKLMKAEEISKDVVDEVIGTNLVALINTTRLLIPILKKNKESAIINIVSKSGIMAQEGQSVYTASKYGVRGFTEVLQLELKDAGVRVAGLYQGGVDTKMFEKTGEDFKTDEFTSPKDLADVVVYMLSQPEKIWLYDVRVDR